MLRIDNACISFEEDLLFSGFSMHLHKGQIACIAGESGCGKTSLLKAILGFLPLAGGTITVDGIVSGKQTIDAIRQRIAWIPQELALPSEWVKEMVQLPFQLKHNRQVAFSEQQLFDCFSELGIEQELYHKRVAEISGGQRQRIMIAVSTLLGKPLIIIDEPTSALDAESADKVLGFFRKRIGQGLAVLAVSHDKQFARGCDQHILL
ncbi:MAG: ABC transporter ATP-binding protein [Bacteroides sp.]|nr:ABC transporter ATP-binding protein [Bacteroides sp.]